MIDAFAAVGSATTSGELYKLGIRDPQLHGLTARVPGHTVVALALTFYKMYKVSDDFDGLAAFDMVENFVGGNQIFESV